MMKIEEIIQEYNMKRVLRDSLPTCDAEIAILEEDENVQKYIRLKEHQKKYQHLANQTDADILDGIIKKDDEQLDDVYFCYGRSFIGYPKKIGGYYIEPNTNSIRHLKGTRVAKYRNLANPDQVIIIQSELAKVFEQSHRVIQYTTAVPDEEFFDIRRRMYEEKIQTQEQESVKRLVKEPNHE